MLPSAGMPGSPTAVSVIGKEKKESTEYCTTVGMYSARSYHSSYLL